MRADAGAGADCLTILRNGLRQRFGAVQALTRETQKLNPAVVEDVVLALHAGPQGKAVWAEGARRCRCGPAGSDQG
jgi:hypothetical protein